MMSKVTLTQTRMPYCERCDRSFRTYNDLYRHEAASSSHNICGDCQIDFPTWTGLKEHWVQSPNHSYCQRCAVHFEDDENLYAHYETEHGFCRSCRKVFEDAYGLREHYRQSPLHHYCVPCNRLFQSANNLKAVWPFILLTTHFPSISSAYTAPKLLHAHTQERPLPFQRLRSRLCLHLRPHPPPRIRLLPIGHGPRHHQPRSPPPRHEQHHHRSFTYAHRQQQPRRYHIQVLRHGRLVERIDVRVLPLPQYLSHPAGSEPAPREPAASGQGVFVPDEHVQGALHDAQCAVPAY